MRNLLILLFAVSIVSCGPKESEKLYEEVMFLHDEVMPRIGEIRNVEKSIKTEIVKALAQDSTADITSLETQLIDAQNAGAGMMNWMRGFKADELETMPEDEKVNYLKEEKVKIEKVNKDIKKVLKIEEI